MTYTRSEKRLVFIYHKAAIFAYSIQNEHYKLAPYFYMDDMAGQGRQVTVQPGGIFMQGFRKNYG